MSTSVSAKDLEARAVDCGVTLDVLKEARALFSLPKLTRNKKRAKKLDPDRYFQETDARTFLLYLPVPKELWGKWLDACRAHGCTPRTLACSLLHHYLMGSWEPREINREWIQNGRALVVPHARLGGFAANKWPEVIRIKARDGTRKALVIRARSLDVPYVGLLRSILLAMFRGEWGQPGTFEFVEFEQTHLDPRRYYLRDF